MDPNGDTVPVWRTQEAWGVLKVGGLQSGMTYEFACQARNADGLITSFGPRGRGTTLPPSVTPPALIGVTVLGPDQVTENTKVTYAAEGLYGDGTRKPLTSGVTWRLSTDQWGVIDNLGVLRAHSVPADQQVWIYARVTEGGRTVIGQKVVIILDVPATADANQVVDANTLGPGEEQGRPVTGIVCPTTSLVITLALVGGILLLRRRSR